MNNNSQQSKPGLGIFHKLLIVLILVSMLPLIVVWYINYRTTTAQITQSVHERLDLISESLVTQVNDLMEMNYRMLRENAAEPAFRSMDSNRQRPILRLIKAQYPWIHSVLVIDAQGNGISRSDDSPLKNYSERHYVQQILNGKPMAYQVLIGKTSGLPGLTLATAIKGKDGRLKGMLVASMAVALISDRIVNTNIGRTGYAFLLDKRGKVIAHESMQDSTFKKDFSTHPALVAHTKQASATLVAPDERDKSVISYMKTTSDGWTLITQQDYDEAFSPIASANRNALLLLLATLAVVLIVAYILSRRLTKPIRHLTAIANEASLANFKALNGTKIAGIERSDEIGELARSVERLALSLRVAIGHLNKGS